MGAYEPGCQSDVVHMGDHDFFSSEQSYIMPEAGTVRIEHVADGTVTVMKDNLELQKGEILTLQEWTVVNYANFLKRN